MPDFGNNNIVLGLGALGKKISLQINESINYRVQLDVEMREKNERSRRNASHYRFWCLAVMFVLLKAIGETKLGSICKKLY